MVQGVFKVARLMHPGYFMNLGDEYDYTCF